MRDEKGRLIYDAKQFSVWLNGTMEADRVSVTALCARSKIQENTLRAMLRGQQSSRGQEGLPKYFEPSARAFAWVAEGLGVEIGYVMERAGFGVDSARWNNFTRVERQLLLAAVRQLQLDSALMEQLRPELSSLVRELEGNIIERELCSQEA